MSELLKALEGKKTYVACIFSVVIACVGFYLKVVTLTELVAVIMAAITFITNRAGNKADAEKVISATTEQTVVLKEHLDKAISVVPCDAPVTEQSLSKAVDAILSANKIQS